MDVLAYVLDTHVEHIFFSNLLQDVFGNTLAWNGIGIAYRVFTIPFPLDTLTGDIATECVRTSLQ